MAPETAGVPVPRGLPGQAKEKAQVRKMVGEGSTANVVGMSMAIALGLAQKKGNLSIEGVEQFFEDLADTADSLQAGKTINETLPGYVGGLIEMFGGETEEDDQADG